MHMKNHLILIKLSYSPKATTLRNKFGNLPVKYCRINLVDEEELYLFESAMREYSFDLIDEDEANEETRKFRKRQYNMLSSNDKDDDLLFLEDSRDRPSTSRGILESPPPTQVVKVKKAKKNEPVVEINDEDDDDHTSILAESQAFL